MRRITALILGLAVVALTIAPSRAQDGERAFFPHDAGIAVIASTIGNDFAVDDLLELVRVAKFRYVVIDWAWITAHWSRTKFDKVEALARRLTAAGVEVAAMYRPRFFAREEKAIGVQVQVGANGKPELPNHREICFADAKAREWGAKWAAQIVKRCPSFPEVIVYNPRQNCQCPVCRAGVKRDPDHAMTVTRKFLRLVRTKMRAVNPRVRLGVVYSPAPSWYAKLRDTIDVARPYVFILDGAKIDRDMKNAQIVRKQARAAGPALAKITWGPGDRVSNAWLAAFVARAEHHRLPFCFWTFSTTFLEGTYDLGSLCLALGVDAKALKPILQRLGGKQAPGDIDPAKMKAQIEAAAADTSLDGWNKMLKLARQYGEASVGVFCELLEKSAVSTARWRAAACLVEIGSNKAVPALLRASRSASPIVRWYCARALGKCGKGDAKVRARLEEMTKDNGRIGKLTVAAEARAALADDSGDDSGDAPESGAGKFIESLPWSPTIEAALVRAKREQRLVLAFVFPMNSALFESGYEGAAAVSRAARAPASGTREQLRARDAGTVKERGILTALLCDPYNAALVERRFVPVRVRMAVQHFQARGGSPMADPLKLLGTTREAVGAPSIVVATPDGTLVHAVKRMGVFSPLVFNRTLRALLLRNKKYNEPGDDELATAKAQRAKPRDRKRYAAWVRALLAAGDLAGVRKALADPPGAARRWARLVKLELALLTASDREALVSARAELLRLRPAAEQRVARQALLSALALRLDRPARAPDGAAEAARASKPGSEGRAALTFRLGLLNARAGEVEAARRWWTDTLQHDADGPWGGRARLRLSRTGPFLREWASGVVLGVDALAGTTFARLPQKQAIESAVRFLLSQQLPSGRWRGAWYATPALAGSERLNLAVARTSLAVCAIRAVVDTLAGKLKERAHAAIAKGAALVAAFSAKPFDAVWDVTYALQLELTLYRDRPASERTQARQRIANLFASALRMENDGGWTYVANRTPPRLHTFNTAPLLILGAVATEQGLAVDRRMLARAAKFLQSQRVGDKAVFHYGSTMHHLTSAERPIGSSMRSPLCEYALWRAGFAGDKKDQARLHEALELFFAHVDDVRATTKVWESFFDGTVLHDAYHYYFGTYYAACAIGVLADAERRKRYALKLREIVLATREFDGSFVDAQISNGKSSSTALALLTLAELQKVLGK